MSQLLVRRRTATAKLRASPGAQPMVRPSTILRTYHASNRTLARSRKVIYSTTPKTIATSINGGFTRVLGVTGTPTPEIPNSSKRQRNDAHHPLSQGNSSKINQNQFSRQWTLNPEGTGTTGRGTTRTNLDV